VPFTYFPDAEDKNPAFVLTTFTTNMVPGGGATYQNEDRKNVCDSVFTLYLTVEINNKEALPYTEADQVGTQKILQNGTIYIRRGEELFDVCGRKRR